MTLVDGTGEGDAPVLVHAVDVTEQRLAERRMRHLVDHDPLTGLLNRRGLAAAMQTQVAQSRRYGSAGALLVLDLDGFKAVNDTLGHDAGDKLLVRIADELRACLRETDVLARLGGDEFAVILPRETLDEAAVVAAKITDRLRGRPASASPPAWRARPSPPSTRAATTSCARPTWRCTRRRPRGAIVTPWPVATPTSCRGAPVCG